MYNNESEAGGGTVAPRGAGGVKGAGGGRIYTDTQRALEVIERFGGIECAHHKAWVIDQVVRCLLGSDEERYKAWVKEMCFDEKGEKIYDWSEGVPP